MAGKKTGHKKRWTLFMGVAGPLVLFSGVFLWCVFNTKHVLPPMTDLNSLQIDDESDPIKLDLEVKNMHNVHHEDITKLAYKPEVYNKVVEYLKPHVPNITEQDISISITPTEEVEVPRFSEYYEVEIKVVGCNIDTSNRLIPGSYIVIRGIVNVHDVLFDITDNLVIEEMNPFVLSKVKDNPEFLPTIDGDYGQIINDYSFRQSILRQMKTINPKITKDDFEISIAEQFETLAENSYEIYVNITATTSSTLIKGSISFPYQVNIEVINVVVVSIGNITLANQTADILVDSVNSVTTIETDAVNNNYELQQVVLKEMRKTSPYVLLSDFTLSNDVAHELYSNQVLEQTCTVTVTATDSSFVIKDSFTFTLNLKIHEQTIHATYNGKYNVGYNLGNSETFNVQGHASVKVTITTIDINFTWDVPRNIIVPNHTYNLMRDFYETGYITKFTANWGQNSIINTDVDSLAEGMGQKDETNRLDDTRLFVPIAPTKNGKNYIFGHRRNGTGIESTSTYQSETPASAPTANMPDIWVTGTASPSNNRVEWRPFWDGIDIKIDDNYMLSTVIEGNKQFRFYVSSLDNNKNFNFSGTSSETKFSTRGNS